MKNLKILYLDDYTAAYDALADYCAEYFDEPKKEDPIIANESIYNFGPHKLYCVQTKKDAISLIEDNEFDLAFIDYELGNNVWGHEVGKELDEIHRKHYQVKLHQVMLTAYENEQRKALQSRVFFDYLTKPVAAGEFSETMNIFNSFYEELQKLKSENQELKSKLQNTEKRLLKEFNKKAIASVNSDKRFESLDRNIIGKSQRIQVVKYFIQKYAETDDNVLIVGETGTGKDLVAEAIHRLSKRNDKPYKPVNCAAIPEELIEPTLFGVISKFPGFHNDKPLIGIFEEAHEGTVFLDEIDRMSLRGQSKLLRLLEDRKVIKLGETEKEGKKVDLRIIAAIKPKAISKIGNEFLEDLYGRLASLFPVIPLLNDRKEDIPQLVEHFIDLIGYNCARVYYGSDNGRLTEKQYPYRKYKQDYGDKKLFQFDDAGMKLLMDYGWKRNVRELRKFIENVFSIFVENKKNWNNQVVPVEDVKRAFIFHDLKEKISKEEQQLLEGTLKSNRRHIKIETEKPSEIKKGGYPDYHNIADSQKKVLIEQFLKLLNVAIENVSKEHTRIKQTVIIKEAIKLNDEEKIFPETISKNAASSITNRFRANTEIIAAILDEKETEYPNIAKLKAYKDLVKPIRK